MFATIIGALLPTVVTLLLGFLAGWHHDFDTKQASVLNSMVMLYALPLSLFTARDQVLSQGPLAFAIFLGMAGGYAIVFFISHYLFRRDLMTASLQALAIAGPAAPFMGVSARQPDWRPWTCWLPWQLASFARSSILSTSVR